MQCAHDIFGRTIEFLTHESKRTPCTCVMKGTMPSGVTLPLHNHRDDESFFINSGTAGSLKGVRRGRQTITPGTGVLSDPDGDDGIATAEIYGAKQRDERRHFAW